MTPKQWQAFTNDAEARSAAEARWVDLHAKLQDAERLQLDEGWTTDDPWPGAIYRRPPTCDVKIVDVETWAFMRALLRGMGEASMRASRREHAADVDSLRAQLKDAGDRYDALLKVVADARAMQLPPVVVHLGDEVVTPLFVAQWLERHDMLEEAAAVRRLAGLKP